MADASRELRSFGRKRGRKISARQRRLVDELLPTLSLPLSEPAIDPAKLFGINVRDVWLEIGFGGAEHLIWQAEHHPDVGFIGCEPFEDGVVKALSAIEAKALANVRLHAGDARDILRRLPDASIGRVFVLFPDPWPKRRHIKRRLLSAATFHLLSLVMRSGAQLRVATDIGDYARTILIAAQTAPCLHWLARSADDWRRRPGDWPQTRYEQKALREGRRPYFLTFSRTPR
ncbi:MAG: tRNA (guanosine(46)-N(7))-methyltransferase TrmB [Hyphomicrobiaceae bacterium]